MTVAEIKALKNGVVNKSVEFPPEPTEASAMGPKTDSVKEPALDLTMRTISVPMPLLRRIERLRRENGHKNSPDEFLTHLLLLGLNQFEKDEQTKDYRPGKFTQ